MAKLSGPQKAAAILLILGESASGEILKHLTTEEIKSLGMQMASIPAVKKELTDELLNEFSKRFYEEGDLYTQGEQFLRNLLPGVLGKEQANDMMSTIEQARQKIPFKFVREIDARVLANFIKSEHPQTIAIILVHLGHEKASMVLGHLPEALQFEVINRVAHLETVPPDLIREVDEVLEKELLSIGEESHQLLGGVQAVAEILNFSDRRTGENILQAMEDFDSDLAEKVRRLMFVFEDLVAINDSGIRELLKEVRNEELTLALKTASEELKNKVFKNLSQRAVQMLEEELSIMGPVRLSDVEAAQQNILNVARRLEKEGKIMLAGRDSGDAFV
ncbi:MAG TPA: flagellar motor switch protein FliG [Syntrophobacteraceae bacterium]|nr:flagellar motor switch protein FliG [Syntrophobacteraceae bacterium]